jgi:hypothetical protein
VKVTRNTYKNVDRKTRREPLERTKRTAEDNNKMDFKERIYEMGTGFI